MTWDNLFKFLGSPVGQALLQSTEAGLMAAISGLFKHVHAQNPTPPAES
jgi:hypothetical protein